MDEDTARTNATTRRTRREAPLAASNGVAAEPPASFGKQPLARVGTRAIRKQLKHIAQALPEIDSDDTEVVHRARVAVRRVRTYARVLEDAPPLRSGRMQALARRLRPLAQTLGEVRDLDVLLQHLQDFADAAETLQPGLVALRDELLWRRMKAQRRLRRVLADAAATRDVSPPRRAACRLARRGKVARRVLVRHFAGDALWRRYEIILAHEASMPDAAPAELHQVRIACKRLRYALELFADDGPSSPAHWLTETLTATQDHLGELQDCVFALQTLASLRHAHPNNSAIADFTHWQEMRRAERRASFAPHWELLSGPRFRQTLAELLATL